MLSGFKATIACPEGPSHSWKQRLKMERKELCSSCVGGSLEGHRLQQNLDTHASVRKKAFLDLGGHT
jgi:hypothetical protein